MADCKDTTFFSATPINCEQNSDSIIHDNNVEIMAGSMEHACIICDNSYQSKYDLKIHLKTHYIHGENTFQCRKCDKVFKYLFRLERHMKCHTNNLPYKCTHCSDSFNHKFQLRHHMTAHTGVKPYQCNHCDSGFNSVIHFRKHLKTHTENTTYICSLCNKKFLFEKKFKIHMESHTNYTCNLCNKTYLYNYKFKRHMKTHTSDLPYKCTHCSDSFKYEFQLTHHMTAHTGDKPYQCNQCDSGFNRVDYFKKHLKTHTEKTSYVCSLCDKTFLGYFKFKEHMDVTHSTSRETLYQCSHCDKTFKTEHTLKRHVVIHIAESPYQCSLCDKGFVVKLHYLKHMEIHMDKRLDTDSEFSKILPIEIVESNLQKDTEQETYQYSDGENAEEECSIRAEPILTNAQTIDCNIVDKKADNCVPSNSENETSTNNVQPWCQSPYIGRTSKAAKKKNIRKNVNMNVENCTTFGQAYALACLTEKGDETSFHRVMKQYSVANNLPVVIHPCPDKEIIEFYSKEIFNK